MSASARKWRKDAAGIYRSHCGQFVAFNEGYARWKLIKGRTVYGPYLSLTECQEAAERKWSVL